MKEGQRVAPATVPWGSADGMAGSADDLSRAPAPPHAPKHRAPEPEQPEDETAEPHVRVDARRLEAALLELRDPIVRVPLLLD